VKRHLALVCASLCLIAAPFAAPPVAQAQDQVLNMQNADIRAFIQDVARVTGQTFVIDPRVQGTVSVAYDRPLNRAQLLEVLLTTLRANGLVAIQTGANTYRVVPDTAAASQPSSLGGERTGFTTQVFVLNSIAAADAAEVLAPLVGPSGAVRAVPQGNLLIIADYADNIARIRSLIDQIDQDRSTLQTVSLQNSSALEIIDVVTALVPEGRVAMAPVASSNSIVLRGDPVTVSEIAAVIAELDLRARTSADVQVVRLQNASAEDILPVLQQVVGQKAEDTANGTEAPVGALGRGGREANIALFEGGNALVISADPETQRILGDVIRQLDVRREQVLVEAIVVEVSDSLARTLGVQFGFGGAAGGVATNFPGNGPSLLGVIGAAAGENNLDDNTALDALQASVANAIAGSNGLLGGVGGEAGDIVLGAIVNAAKSDTASNILSTPSIVTLDNEPAILSVGQEVPVTTGEVLGDANTNPFRTIERRDVGVKLEVTPQINAGGGITLELTQEVSSVAGPVVAGFPELAFNKRLFSTTVIVDDGDIVVLGGLLDQSNTQGSDKVPGLGDIPGIGALFRSNSRTSSQRNLMLFIRPTIVRNRLDAQAITARNYEYMRGQEIMSREDARSALEEAVREYLQALPPQVIAP
jgi:general secretion pathway protein D